MLYCTDLSFNTKKKNSKATTWKNNSGETIMFGTLLERAFFFPPAFSQYITIFGPGVTVVDFSSLRHIYLFICLLFNHLYQDPLQCTCKIAGLSLEGLLEAKFTSGVSYINSSVMATSRKLIITFRLLKLTLAANFFAVI